LLWETVVRVLSMLHQPHLMVETQFSLDSLLLAVAVAEVSITPLAQMVVQLVDVPQTVLKFLKVQLLQRLLRKETMAEVRVRVVSVAVVAAAQALQV
jgi:hypothetical protein